MMTSVIYMACEVIVWVQTAGVIDGRWPKMRKQPATDRHLPCEHRSGLPVALPRSIIIPALQRLQRSKAAHQNLPQAGHQQTSTGPEEPERDSEEELRKVPTSSISNAGASVEPGGSSVSVSWRGRSSGSRLENRFDDDDLLPFAMEKSGFNTGAEAGNLS